MLGGSLTSWVLLNAMPSRRTSAFTPDMPWPVIDLGQGRCKLWVRIEIEAWQSDRGGLFRLEQYVDRHHHN